jgi:DNA-binding response OmpR family regulator
MMGKRVLIAEDEEAIARLVQASLKKAGHEGVIALDGRIAIHRLDTETFDFVVLDLLMPYYDGSEVLRHIRTREKTRDLPVVILATCPPSEADELIRAYEYSPIKFIRKPFTPSELIEVVGE